MLPLSPELEEKLIEKSKYKLVRCEECGADFYKNSKNKIYCDQCAKRRAREQRADYKRRKRGIKG